MNTFIFGVLLLIAMTATSNAAPSVDDNENEEPDSEPTEASSTEDSPPPESGHGESTKDPLTPSQHGRLSRFNGNFFQLYGATNQLEGNLDAIAGNQLAFRGNLIEFLGNEHSLRELAVFLKQAQAKREVDAGKATGAEKELELEEARILGELKELVEESAGKEHEQAQEKARQFNLETRAYKLEKEEVQLKSRQAVSELEQGNLEEEQIRLENKGRKALIRLMEIEKQRQEMDEQN